MEIRTNYLCAITPKMNLLQVPIVDQYFVPPASAAARPRGTEYAEAKGLLNPSTSRPRASSGPSVGAGAAMSPLTVPAPPEAVVVG